MEKWLCSAVLLSAVALACPASAQSGTNDLELIPEDLSLLKESLLWDKDVVLRAGFGYKDNVLLAPGGRQGSAFFTSGLDLTVFRLPLDGLEFTLTILGDDVRYFRNPGGLRGEDLFIASAQVQKYFGSGWRLGLEGRYSYVDQVLEEFLVQGGAQAVEAKGHLALVRPFLRRDLSTNWWIQLEAPLSHEWWQSPLDSTWKYGGQGVLGFDAGVKTKISLTGGGFYIPHSEWLARDNLGAELAGRKLAIWRQVAELKWDQFFDTQRHWSANTRLGYNHSDDNGGGYFDNSRYYVAQEFRFHTSDWDVKVSAGYSYYDFPVQPIDTPPAPTLHLGTFDASGRVERRIYKSIRGFAKYEYEQTASNDPTSEYRYHTVTGGMSWEF